MYSLVRYLEDDILYVLNNKHIRRINKVLSAKYINGYFYSCQVLYSHDNVNYLYTLEKQLLDGCYVNLRKCDSVNVGKPKGETYGDNEENSNFSPPSDILGAEDYVLYNNEDNDLSPMDENENYIPSTENDGRSIKEKENLVEHWRSQCNSQPVIEGNSNISPALKIPRAEDYILYDSEDSAISTIDEDVDYEPSTDNTSSDENDKLVEEDQRFNKKNEDQIINTTVNKEKDSSANSSLNKTKDLSVNQSPLGELMKNPTTVVKSSSSGIKKYSCKYCHKLVAKLARHIETVHQDLDEVKKLKLLPKIRREKNKSLSMSSRARLKIINAIRAKGNFEHNIKCTLYDNFIPCRRPQKNKSLKTVSSFAICPNCKDAFSKATLHKHYNKCSGQSSKYNRDIQCMSREVTGNIHEKAEPLLRKLVSRMRNDDVTTIIKYDYLVVLFGNLEAYKYRHSQHHTKMIRAKLRRLGRLLLEFKKVQTNITDFSSIFDPSNFSNFLKAVNNLGNFDERKDLYDTPATAFALGTLTKELSDIWIADCIEKKDMEKKILAEEFMHLYNLKFSKIVNKTVMESQTEMRIKKKVILPSLEDIKKLHNYLVEKRSKAFQDLKSEFNFKSWKTLLETTLISIQLLNRRRAGEIERLKLVHYTSLEKMENSNFDIYNNLSINAKTIANKYARILLRGKLNRTVPVLLDSEMIECLELIRKFRKEANVSRRNPYLFGIPGSVNNPEKWPSACDLMRKFSSKCDADMPFTLRGTLLRKHVATCCISLNLTNGEIDDLAKFMGHDKNIHLNIYRQPVATKDILEISQLLEKAQGIETNRNMQLNEIEIDLNMLQECPEMSSSDLEQDLDNCNPPSMNVEKQTPYKKTKWDPQSCAAVMNAFENDLSESKLPSSFKIRELINKTPCLQSRTVPQIRTWLHSKRKILYGERGDNSQEQSPQRRNTIPNTIYLLFARHIAEKKVPTLQDCYATYSKSPTLDKYNPKEIQDLVKKVIEQCD